MDYDKTSRKIPKYTITQQAGFYPSMQSLTGRDGKISMYLQESKNSGSKKSNAPAMKLQAKDSLNFTGIKDYFVNGRLSGYAYGYPLSTETYSSKKKPNPMYGCRNDGFLFVFHFEDKAASDMVLPSYIELIVLKGAKLLISAYCKQLVMGGFDEALAMLREQAQAGTSL